MNDCIFCKIVKKEIPAYVVWEDGNHIAFLSPYPNTDGFTVVASKKHLTSNAFNNSDKELCEMVIATKKVAQLIDNAFDDVGRCGMFFEGFGVDHFHSKLYPMHGTNINKWRPILSRKPIFFKKYPGYLSSQDGKKADKELLAKIADKIKNVSKI